MPAANPLVALSGGGVAWGTAPGPGGGGVNGYAQQSSDPAVGTGSLTAPHNTPLHVGSLVILGVAVVVALRALGFRFVVGANIASGVGA